MTADTKGNPFSWVSGDPAVAKVDQLGNVTASGVGITAIKAIPLYGYPVECLVTVEISVSSAHEIASDNVRIEIYPNPCRESLHVIVPGQSYQIARVEEFQPELP